MVIRSHVDRSWHSGCPHDTLDKLLAGGFRRLVDRWLPADFTDTSGRQPVDSQFALDGSGLAQTNRWLACTPTSCRLPFQTTEAELL